VFDIKTNLPYYGNQDHGNANQTQFKRREQMARTVKVKDLTIGDKIKFHNTEVYVVGLNTKKALLNKNKAGLGIMSISFFSQNYEDIQNRCELAEV